MAVEKKLYTAEEFERIAQLPENRERKLEYIDGEIIDVPSNPYSSKIAAFIIFALMSFVLPRRLGHVTGEQGGYVVAGAKVAPDVAFISYARQPELAREGYNPNPPEFAVEVVSPTDKADDVENKVRKYLEAGVLTWVVYPEAKRVLVHAPGVEARTLGVSDTLDGGTVLPGFTLEVGKIFEG